MVERDRARRRWRFWRAAFLMLVGGWALLVVVTLLLDRPSSPRLRPAEPPERQALPHPSSPRSIDPPGARGAPWAANA